ncbi:MAG: hypothetical protein IT380_01570 [Myxococcales bacterium]|nr:hypothetical protein [Myxococcales bacterium]
MTRNLWLWMAVLAVSLVGCGGPDATAMVGVDDGVDDVETVEGELTSTSRAATWLPMQEGNRWTFTSATSARTVTLTDVGDGMALLSGLFAHPVWVGTASENSTTLLMWNGAKWVPFVRFGYARTAWILGEGRCTTYTARRSGTGVLVSTPAQDFADTRVISFEQKPDPVAFCTPPAFTELSFAPRVGLVGFKTGRGERFTLASASVNGNALPSVAVAARVTLDQARYTSKPNTIACITTPCPGNAETAVAKVRFEVTNTSSQAQVFRFTSGCQFDVEALTAGGRVVGRLSERRACTFAMTTLRLEPGKSVGYDADFALEDSQGLQLDGEFTLRAFLTSSSGAMGTPPSASAPVSVRVVSL